MDTIKRLGEQETLNRIVTGTLKSYVDHDIDSVDTSQFLNLETLNVPKAESVVIGEGVKDTLEVLNAPKAEEVAVDSGLVVNWGKCGGSSTDEDVIRTYKSGDPITIPVAFFTDYLTENRNGIKGNNDDKKLEGVGYLYGAGGSYAVYRLPQNIGKWLYENAESATGPMNPFGGTTYRPFYKGIGTYSDGVLGHEGDEDTGGWGIGIRTYDDINIRDKYDWTSATERTVSVRASEWVRAGEYYAVIQFGTGVTTMTSCLKIHEDLDLTDLECKRWLDMTALPSSTNKGTKYTYPSNNTLSNLPNLKVADVHTMDVDVPMFKGCTNLERATVGGKKLSSPIVVEWGENLGGTVTFNEGDELYIPNEFMFSGYISKTDRRPKSNLSSAPSSNYVGYVGYCPSKTNRYLIVFKLPTEFGKYLYEKAESGKYPLWESYDTTGFYKGLWCTPLILETSSQSINKNYGIGIRKKSDIWQWNGGGDTISENATLKALLDDDSYYLVFDYGYSTDTFYDGLLDLYTDYDFYLYDPWKILPDTYTNVKIPHSAILTWSNAPTLDSSYFEGCDNLKEVTITNPELRMGDAIHKTMKVNWGKCGGTEDVIVEYGEGEGLSLPNEFIITSVKVGKDEVGLIDNSFYGANSKYLWIYRLPQTLGKYLYDNAESVTEEIPYAYSDVSDYNKIWKGIATYADSMTEYSGSKWLSNSLYWGVGIRTGADLKDPNGSRCKDYEGNLVTYPKDVLPDTVKALLNDSDYYLVSECAKSNTTGLPYANGDSSMAKVWEKASGPVYLRHWNTMESAPNGTTIMGAKYTVPSELIEIPTLYADESKVPVEAQPLVVNWGKCGGEDDVIVEYNMGDPISIPKGFLTQAYTSTSSGCTPNADKLDTSIGYKTWFGSGDCDNGTRTSRVALNTTFYTIYKLPQNLGEYLHKSAENYNGTSYTGVNIGTNNTVRIYKGIAIYSDTVTSWSGKNNLHHPRHWGIGIRKKNELKYIGLASDLKTPTTDGGGGMNNCRGIDNLPEIKALEDDAYYLIAQCENTAESDNWIAWGMNYWIEQFGTGNIYFRHWRDMTTAPSATNLGVKYTIPAELCRPQKNVYYSKTKKKDSLTVNWGKCGGNSDVVVTYKEGDGIWIPKAFLEEGYNESTRLPKDDVLNKEVGYQTWFGYDDWSGTSRHDVGSSAYICVYKLPQELGKWLYENAEDSIKNTTSYAPSGLAGSVPLYHGIAIYPDTVGSNTSSQWTYSYGWGVGIRKKEDIAILGLNSSTYEPTSSPTGLNYKNLESFDQWKALEDDAYYLVSQCIVTGDGKDRMESYLPMFENPIYFRHWNTLSTKPTQSLTTHGEKYTVPSELCPPLQITMAEYLEENNPNYNFRMK